MIEFVTMADGAAAADVLRMMQALYAEDAPELVVDVSRFPLTIVRLLTEPHLGRIVLFMDDAAVCGYALVVPYWSNECGGTMLLVDELFVEKESRGQGIARAFFAFLMEQPPFRAVALSLEVSPENPRARALYESLGFRERHHRMLMRRLETAV